MLIRFFSLIALFILLGGCVHKTSHKILSPGKSSKPPALKSISAQKSMNLEKFSHINVRGVIDVSLHTGYKNPKVILKGDPRDLKQVNVYVDRGTLYIRVGKGYPDYGRVTAVIQGRALTSFNYEGAGVIKGTRLHSSALDLCILNDGSTLLNGSIGLRRLTLEGKGVTRIHGINSRYLQVSMKGRPHVQLTGKANLSQLDMDGGQLSLYWLNSPCLNVHAHGTAIVNLAGITDELHVELWDNAKFKGQHLRANRSFVKTHDRSVAQISTVKKQHTLASDISDIYYYTIPDMQTNFMAYTGSVLDMRNLAQPDLEEYDRYNKHIP